MVFLAQANFQPTLIGVNNIVVHTKNVNIVLLGHLISLVEMRRDKG